MEYIVKDLNLTQLTSVISDLFCKKSGKPIKLNDVQGYIKRKKLPIYMGDIEIKENTEIKCVKLYSLIKNG